MSLISTEPPLTTSALNREEELQGTSSQPSTQEESNFSQAEVQTDLCIKDEQEEHEHDRQTQEVIYPSTETEQDQPVNEVSAEMQPVSSDGSEAESEIKGGGEEVVQNEGAQRKMRRKTDRTFSVSGQTDLHVCPMCGKGFWFISPLVKHMKKHKKINGPTKKLLKDMQRFLRRKDCNVCGKKFTTTHCLRLHSKIHAAIRDFKCQVCGITFCKRRNLIRNDFAKCKKDRHVCPSCGKSFRFIHHFRKHIKTHTKPIICDVCNKTFTATAGLQIHLMSHTRMKDFQCQDCGKSFVQKEHLNVHMRTHSGERQYECDVCGRRFYTRGHLKSHEERFRGRKLCSCDVCGKRFCQRAHWMNDCWLPAAGAAQRTLQHPDGALQPDREPEEHFLHKAPPISQEQLDKHARIR
uniref:C2H2-type domain-containing protein n=1 Tax=Labrus bergylta TaxID=56723 RepID=A0A3Q3MFR8_9LABR